MKRLRDDVCVNPQVKRPCGSSARGESNGLPHGPVGGGGGGIGVGGTGGSGTGTGATAASTQKLTANDALTYLKIVKDMFQDQREKYDRFLDAMKDFKAQRIDTSGVITRVKELFKDYPNLILGFNTFLPKGYEINLTDEKEAPSKRIVEFEDAISFVNKIKKRFQNDDHVYKSFLAILNMYRKEHKGIAEVHQEVAALFQDQPELLDEFTRFLPDNSASASASHTIMTQSRIDKQLPRQNRIIGSHREHDPSFDRPDVDDDKTVLKLQNENKQHSESESRDERSHGQDGRDPGNENNGDISMQRLCDESKCTQKVEDSGGNSNLPSNNDKDALKSIYCHEFTFCEKVKERLHSAKDYQAFLKCLHIYSTEIITRKELQGLVSDLIGNYPDLMEGFYEFLERCERIDGFLAGVMGKKTLWTEGHSLKALRIEEKNNGQKHEWEGRKESDDLKYFRKSIQELDLSNCKSCTPSYRLLPKDCLLPSASERSELDARVLNNRWVSVTSGSEDYSFKHMQRNQYEETLFRCEDDRFELDMLLESVSSTAKRAEELLNSINNNSIGSDGRIIVEDHFTVLNLRCIERLYGEHGLDVMDILRKNATLALPVILTRLKQKQEEWTRSQLDFNKVWAEIYSKNHYKSLDHQGFYFKQLDSKTLSAKSLVSEIKEIKNKKQKEDDMSFGIAAGSEHSIFPNLEFENTDVEIHEDIYKIIKYSSKEVCSTEEQFNRVLTFWTTFLEPMLGVPSRPDGSEAVEDDSASKHRTVTKMLESEESPSANATSTNLKQSKPDFIGDSNNSTQQINDSWKGFTDADVVAKDGLTVASNDSLPNTDVVFNTKPNPNHGHGVNSLLPNNDAIKESRGSRTKDIHSPEGVSTLWSNQSMNGKFPEGSRFDGQTEDSFDHCKIEKEEGELPPNGDFEDNFGFYQNVGSQAKNNCSIDEMLCRTRCLHDISSDAAGKNDADVEDKDNENAFEAADIVLGGESAAVECPQEEHKVDEDGEQDNLDGKLSSEGETEDTLDAHDIAGDGSSLPLSECFLLTCKPLSKHIATHLVGDETKDRRVFYGNDSYYVLFRLHQTLYERIFSAKVNSLSSESNSRTTKDMNLNTYGSFMDALFSLLGGSSDNSNFEDDCRSLIGNQSYVLFTLDKLIYKLVKQLQTVLSEKVDCKLLLLYEYEKSRKQEKFDDSVYYENVHVLLHKENIYRFERTSFPTRLSIQLVDDGSDKSGVIPVSVDPNFTSYLHNGYLSVFGEEESSTMMLKSYDHNKSFNQERVGMYDGRPPHPRFLTPCTLKTLFLGLDGELRIDQRKDLAVTRKVITVSQVFTIVNRLYYKVTPSDAMPLNKQTTKRKQAVSWSL